MRNYRKTYLCICEGQQEKMYMNHVAKLIKNFPKKVVTFNIFIDTPHRLKKRYEEYDSAAIFDFDMNEVEFKKNIEICDRLNRDLKSIKRKSERHIYHAYSSVNFDLWLILHKEDYSKIVSKNDAYVQDLRRIYGLNATDNIKNEEINRKILDQITLDNVKEAIHRAEKIRYNKNVDNCQNVGDTKVYTNPDFSIHEFLKIVLRDSGDL